jgi:hypothetical protein
MNRSSTGGRLSGVSENKKRVAARPLLMGFCAENSSGGPIDRQASAGA